MDKNMVDIIRAVENSPSKGYHITKEGKYTCHTLTTDGKVSHIGYLSTEHEAKELSKKLKIKLFCDRVLLHEKDICSGRCWKGKYIAYPDGKIFTLRGRLVKGSESKGGYRHFVIDGGDISFHRIVASLFVPNPDNKPQVNHIDGNPRNNHASNLEWVTNQENIQHAFRTGLHKGNKGERNPRCKINEEIVKYIREHYKSHSREFGAKPLGERFGLTMHTVLEISHGRIWKHIPLNAPKTPSEAE